MVIIPIFGFGDSIEVCICFGPSTCLDVQNGLGAASTCMGKLYFLPDLLELRDLPSSNTTKICPRNKPISDANRQKKNKDHF
jgi:hypothetical protein